MRSIEYERYFVAFRLETPLTIGTGMDAQNHRVTLRHIPGSVMRGSLGRLLYRDEGLTSNPLRETDTPGSPVLDELFGIGGIRFGPLYPAWDEGDFGKQLHQRVLETMVIPLSTWTCKTEPGLTYGQRYEDSGHIVIDYALPDDHQVIKVAECKCGGRLERLRGYVVRVKDHSRDANHWVRVSPSVHTKTRVGLNRQSATAEPGILYSIQSVQPILYLDSQEPQKNLVFAGHWSMTKEQHASLIKRLRPHRGDVGYALAVGARQANGFGQGMLWIADKPEVIGDCLAIHHPDDGKMVFTLTARSPIVCRDEAGIAQVVLSPDVIRGYYPDAPNFRLLESGIFVERARASGWSGLWGLSKPVADCISPGSAFSYISDASPKELSPFLEDLARNGLGEMLEDGFGQVEVNHGFHQHFGVKEEGND